jgi:hypothetical protein
VYLHIVAWEGVGEDTEISYSACRREISQNALIKKGLFEGGGGGGGGKNRQAIS